MPPLSWRHFLFSARQFSSGSLHDSFQIIKRINSRRVSIRPDRLNRVSAHIDQPHQPKCIGRNWALGIFINVSHDIRFALASRARAMASQFFQRNETFALVIPFDRQFPANHLNICRSHKEDSKRIPCLPQFRSFFNPRPFGAGVEEAGRGGRIFRRSLNAHGIGLPWRSQLRRTLRRVTAAPARAATPHPCCKNGARAGYSAGPRDPCAAR
jgi:hypothetical protein